MPAAWLAVFVQGEASPGTDAEQTSAASQIRLTMSGTLGDVLLPGHLPKYHCAQPQPALQGMEDCRARGPISEP